MRTESGRDKSHLTEDLRRIVSGEIRPGEPMSKHTSFRVGGPVGLMLFPASASELIAAIGYLVRNEIPYKVIGNGTNLLVSDGGLPGYVFLSVRKLTALSFERPGFSAEAGASLSLLSRRAAELGLSGLEFAAGIPGTVGGAVRMNAGAHGGSMADVLVEVEVVRPGGVTTVAAEDLELGYRDSRLRREPWTVLSAKGRLVDDDPQVIKERIREYSRIRQERQPRGASAGSVFKNPSGGSAGALIEAAGLKGYRIGGARVSPRHANFIINEGGASAADIYALIQLARDRVRKRFGIELETEIELLGFS